MRSRLRIAAIALAALLVPAVASTAMTEEGSPASGGGRQFTVEGALPSGDALTATVVAAPSEEGRAKVALSNAISRAQQFYGEILGAGGVASQLAGLEKGESIKLSPTAFDFIQKARTLAPQTDGFFDITAPSPKHAFIKSDWRRIALDPEGRTVTFKSDDIKLDLKRIALGYACDLMMETVKADGFANASVTAGPISRNEGRDIYTPWDIVVGFGERTDTGTHRAYRYGISGIGAATVTPGGLGLGLIDPLNKKQVNWESTLRSVTVIAADATTATAFALAAYTVGPKYAMKYVMGHTAIRGIVVDGEGNLYASKELGITSVPYEKSIETASDGGPDDQRLKEREEKNEAR